MDFGDVKTWKKYKAGSDTKVIELELDRIADYFGSAPDPVTLESEGW